MVVILLNFPASSTTAYTPGTWENRRNRQERGSMDDRLTITGAEHHMKPEGGPRMTTHTLGTKNDFQIGTMDDRQTGTWDDRQTITREDLQTRTRDDFQTRTRVLHLPNVLHCACAHRQ